MSWLLGAVHSVAEFFSGSNGAIVKGYAALGMVSSSAYIVVNIGGVLVSAINKIVDLIPGSGDDTWVRKYVLNYWDKGIAYWDKVRPWVDKFSVYSRK